MLFGFMSPMQLMVLLLGGACFVGFVVSIVFLVGFMVRRQGRNVSGGHDPLEAENQRLRAENKQLRQELADGKSDLATRITSIPPGIEPRKPAK